MHRCKTVWGTGALLALTLVFSACAMSPSAAVPTAAAIVEPTATPTPTPTPPPPPPPNDLGEERITQIVTVDCPGAIGAESVRMLVQAKADAVDFFATTHQCGDLPLVLAAGDDVTAFTTPLQYVDAPCQAGTMFTVWAHYDDDLIFGSPSIPLALDAGQCVRNLYLTGSDAGKGLEYARERENGLRHAYDALLGGPRDWTERTVTLANGLTLAMSRPAEDARVAFFFLRLPDGGLDAEGFESTGWTSLPKLLAGTIGQLQMIDTGAPVDLDGIGSTVAELYGAYDPLSVMAHLPGRAKGTSGDHPDHQVTGDIVMMTTDSGQIDASRVVYSQGYPIENRDVNLGGDLLARKLEAFAIYAAHDPMVKCTTVDTCLKTKRFGPWLLRQYLTPHTEIIRP
ncbi:PIG-L family deacetylase [Microbacterium paludicola]|uniref:PIG-L family deacetylase n=1 Tax=Microbacterium paludicola TaxID=300019 RepID=UPI0011A5FB49|nr:PIG-L family deacetylase [Microbacterium paludicola]